MPTPPRLPSLDGIRAISILLVVACHALMTYVPDGHLAWLVALSNGLAKLGVLIFFVLSGFLITSLLLGEREKTGTIHLGHFYLRRAFRIWPAFYVYLAVILVCWKAGAITLTWPEFVCAALFVWNYGVLFMHFTSGADWFLGHSWTLAMEEQFYLLWPLLLWLLKSRRAVLLAAGLIVLSPVIRIAQFLLAPDLRGQITFFLHTRADTLMFGCLAALLFRSERFQRFLQRLYARSVPLLAFVFVFVASPLLTLKFAGRYLLSVGWTLESAGVIVMVLWAMQNADSAVGRFLNSKVLVHLGVISYSLYLWQQLFLARLNTTVTGRFPLSLLCALLAAEASYFFVEQPFLRLRHRLVP